MKTTLEQWRALIAVIDQGGFSPAAKTLFKSQSTVSHAVNRLQESLNLELLVIPEGARKAKLTEAGVALVPRARQLLADAEKLESVASAMQIGWESELRIVVEQIFPQAVILSALKEFTKVSRGTRVQLAEEILSGTTEALASGKVHLVVTGIVPKGVMVDPLMNIQMVCVASPENNLFALNRDLSADDLRRDTQIVIRDSGQKTNIDVNWLMSEQRWTVSSIQTAIDIVAGGIGFSMLPLHGVWKLMQEGKLKQLPLEGGGRRKEAVSMVYGMPDHIGPATRKLASLIYDQSQLFSEQCKQNIEPGC